LNISAKFLYIAGRLLMTDNFYYDRLVTLRRYYRFLPLGKRII